MDAGLALVDAYDVALRHLLNGKPLREDIKRLSNAQLEYSYEQKQDEDFIKQTTGVLYELLVHFEM